MPKKGYKPTEEHRKNLSNARKGFKQPEEWKKRMSKWHKKHPNSGQFKKGYIVSKETRQKMSKAKKGWVPSQNWREKMSKLHKGKKGYWLGKQLPRKMRENISKARTREWHTGIRKNGWDGEKHIYKEKQNRNDPAYHQWVKNVKRRDNNICRLKDETCFGYNIVHHIRDWSAYPKLRYKVNNGITLCQAH